MSEGAFYNGGPPPKNPEGEMKYHYFIDVEPICTAYRVELEDLSIVWLHQAKANYFKTGSTEYATEARRLQNDFVCVYRKTMAGAPHCYTFAKIYAFRNAVSRKDGL